MNVMKRASLFFQEGRSDKEYHIQLGEVDGGYVVNFQYGRRGSSLLSGTKTAIPVTLDKAGIVYDRLYGEKVGKGYQDRTGDTPAAVYVPAVVQESVRVDMEDATPCRKINLGRSVRGVFIPQLLDEITEDEAERYINDPAWGMQEKKDGVHKTLHRRGGVVTVTNKKGKVVGFPSIFGVLPGDDDLVFDGEAIGETFHIFDCLEAGGRDLRGMGYGERHAFLVRGFRNVALNIVPLITGTKAKRDFFNRMKVEKREGVVFKRLDAVYKSGKGHGDMYKCKFWAELSARVASRSTGKDSVYVELLDDRGTWVEMGKVTTIGKGDIRPGMVIEVKYLYCLRGGSLYQPSVKMVRDDVGEGECLMSQVKYKPEE